MSFAFLLLTKAIQIRCCSLLRVFFQGRPRFGLFSYLNYLIKKFFLSFFKLIILNTFLACFLCDLMLFVFYMVFYVFYLILIGFLTLHLKYCRNMGYFILYFFLLSFCRRIFNKFKRSPIPFLNDWLS